MPAYAEGHPKSKTATLTHISIGTTLTLQGIDLSQTMYMLGSNDGHEANPMFAPFVSSPELAGAVKMGSAAVTSWAILKFHARHPRLALATSIATNIFLGYVVIRNSRIRSNVR